MSLESIMQFQFICCMYLGHEINHGSERQLIASTERWTLHLGVMGWNQHYASQFSFFLAHFWTNMFILII